MTVDVLHLVHQAVFGAVAASGFGVLFNFGWRLLRARLGIANNALAVAGCIPMVPGFFAAQAIFGLFALTAPQPGNPSKLALTTLEFALRVIFTAGAIGAGLSIATHILRSPDSWRRVR